ncbi:MAG: ABC transporter substrate-binding protein, partial [Lachnospiraceae bacterium]|nr:ABC transporter substrate-binding protein [Lachnospiraceae bacterium]
MKKIIALLLGIALTAVALSGCGARAQAAGIGDNGKELVDFNIGHLPATGHILYFIAYEEGFFKEEGLNVTLTQYSNNTEELAALEAGKLDVAPINATNLIKFLGEGHEVTSFGGVMSDGHALVVDPDVVEGLSEDEYRRNLEVLKGKTIVLQANSTYDIEFRIALKEAGFDLEKDITILTADSGTDAYNSLKNKEIDGAAVYAPFRQIALNEGYVPVIYCDEVEYFEHPICCREVTLTENIEKDPDKYVSFTRAMIKASVFLLEDHEKSIEDALKYLDVDKAILTEDTYNHSINNPDPDEAKTITFYNAMKELGYIENEVNVKDYINNSIYEKALDSLINEDPDNTYLKDLKQYHEGALYAG